jgi:hypothetical protein
VSVSAERSVLLLLDGGFCSDVVLTLQFVGGTLVALANDHSPRTNGEAVA